MKRAVPIAVRVSASKTPGLPWRSVVLIVRRDGFEKMFDAWDGLKALGRRVAKSAGLDPKRARTVYYTGSRRIVCYVRIYRGPEPTPAEKKLFRRVFDIATRLAPEHVEFDEALHEQLTNEGVKLPELPEEVFP